MPEVAEKNLTLTVMALAERLAAHLIDDSSTTSQWMPPDVVRDTCEQNTLHRAIESG